MGTNRNQKQWNQVMQYYKDGYTKAQIGRMVGLSRQRICVIIDSYERWQRKLMNDEIKMTDFQLRKLDTIVFDKIKMFLLDSNIPLTKFCKMIDKEQKTTYRAERFLTGKSKNVTPDMIAEIVRITGVPVEELSNIKYSDAKSDKIVEES